MAVQFLRLLSQTGFVAALASVFVACAPAAHQGVAELGSTSDGLTAASPSKGNSSVTASPTNVNLPTTSAPAIAFETVLGDRTPENPAALFDLFSVELGVQLIPKSKGHIHAVRFYQASGGLETYRASIWAANGQLIATAEVTPSSTEPGWLTARFSPPIAVSAGELITASYNASSGAYPYEYEGLASPLDSANVSFVKSVYIYGDGSTVPEFTYRNTNYFVDVVFKREGQ
jgi:hypothetical protein